MKKRARTARVSSASTRGRPGGSRIAGWGCFWPTPPSEDKPSSTGSYTSARRVGSRRAASQEDRSARRDRDAHQARAGKRRDAWEGSGWGIKGCMGGGGLRVRWRHEAASWDVPRREGAKPYVLALSGKAYVWAGFRQQHRISEVLQSLKQGELPSEEEEEDWRRLSVGEGSKGPRLYDWLRLPLNPPLQEVSASRGGLW